MSHSCAHLPLACVAVAMGVMVFAPVGPDSDAMLLAPPATPASSPEVASAEANPVASDPLVGLWTRYEDSAEGAPLRFWYFHGDGHGLYRYGRIGLNHTNSFDYVVGKSDVELVFRKTGERHRIDYRVERNDGGSDSWLVLDGDPKEPGARYRKLRGGMNHVDGADVAQMSSEGLGGRLWLDHRNYATGGSGFRMYQLNASAIDGRGVGWYHQGDFDDWSTESLTYRVDGDHLELFFDLREEPGMSHFDLTHRDDRRWLNLHADPRDYWSPHSFLDAGASFGAAHQWHWVTAATQLAPR